MRNRDPRGAAPADGRFAGLVTDRGARDASGGLLHARGAGRKTLGFAATRFIEGKPIAPVFYEMDADMKLRRSEAPGALEWMRQKVAIPRNAIAHDAASAIYTDEQGRRFRLPKGDGSFAGEGLFGAERAVREVCTERDLLNCAGTFFELPAENAGGITKVRPIATHGRRVHDFATWRGLLVISGVESSAPAADRHLIRSEDGRVALWVETVDDLWSVGKPVGQGAVERRDCDRAPVVGSVSDDGIRPEEAHAFARLGAPCADSRAGRSHRHGSLGGVCGVRCAGG